MAHAQFLEAEGPQALLSHMLFHTRDVDEAREGVAKVFSPHDLRVMGSGGTVDSCMHHVSLGGITLSRLRYGTTVDIDPGCTDNFYLVQMPISGICEVSCGKDTVASSPRVASVITPTLPMWEHWEVGCDKVIVKIDRALLERHCARHLGHELTKPINFQLGMDLESNQVESWRRLVELLVSEVDHGGAMLASPLIRANFEQTVAGALLFSQPSNYIDDLRRPPLPIAPYYVKRAEEYMRSHVDEPISVIELAEYAGVGTRALYAGFQNFRGVSPMAFLKSLRLDQVRQALLAGPNQATVTEIAMRWGFSHLGHFAAAYRKKFGESPCQTMRAYRADPGNSFGPH